MSRWGYPGQVQMGGTTAWSRWGVHWPGPDGIPWQGMEYPPPPEVGYPLSRGGVPPRIGQQMEFLMCSGWYASSIHAGGLFLVYHPFPIKGGEVAQVPQQTGLMKKEPWWWAKIILISVNCYLLFIQLRCFFKYDSYRINLIFSFLVKYMK